MKRAWLALLLWPAVASLPAVAADEMVTLRVMTFNVWYGGEQVSLEKVGEAIRAANADIVGVQEADRNLERIAEVAGMPYVDPRRRLLSRWPIFDSGSGLRSESGPSPYSTTALDLDALHAWIMVRPGRVVAVANVHLSSGAGEDAVRLAETRPLEALGRLAADGIPVYLTGDFNSPSHLDAAASDRERPEDANPLDRAVTRVLADSGLRDSFREAYPDSVKHPGFTWTPGAPHPLLDHDRSRSRIDYVFTGGRSTTVGSGIVGELDGLETDIEVFPWPSDHRAVVSTFQVVPADAPALISAAPRLVQQGASVLVRTWDPHGPAWTALVVRRGGEPRDALTGVRDMPHDYQRTIPLSTVGLAAGDYDVVLVGEDGAVLRRSAFTIAAPGARPEIVAISPSTRIGEPIRVRWRNAPGDLRDWIGLYRAGETDVSQYLGFIYTEAAFAGETSFVPDATDGRIVPGDYEIRLLHDESYVVLAKAPITLAP
ncbi:MAG TPA: endonuclease/exonuclease/phosphatase family protein [Steroidobacteraceae bacterium]|nr:endonuclease/exonuclease/phosphatase family protein [Steroidobacteraceae bacterium]